MDKSGTIFPLKTRLIIMHRINELPLLEARVAGTREVKNGLSLITDGRANDQMIGYSLSLSCLGKEVWVKEKECFVI